MKVRICIIGGDSFIARIFIRNYLTNFNYTIFSRTLIGFKNEYLKQDFYDISIDELRGSDVMINFAAIVHQPTSKDEMLYKHVNYELPVDLAQKAKEAGIKHFIQMSTIAVYGNASYIDNTTEPDPVNFYGKYKLMADIELMKLQNDLFGISIIRPSMIYGGGSSPGNMLNLIGLVKKGIPLPFKGIENSRTFLNVNNLTSIIEKVILLKKVGTIIIADEEAYSTYEIISKINNCLNVPNRQFKFSLFWKCVKLLKPDLYRKLTGDLKVTNTHKFSDLGIVKNYNMEDGLKEMI